MARNPESLYEEFKKAKGLDRDLTDEEKITALEKERDRIASCLGTVVPAGEERFCQITELEIKVALAWLG